MTTIDELQAFAKAGFTQWETLGDIRAVEQDEMVLLSYRHPSEWNEAECLCRGLILSREGEVIARPFDKFFNWFERGRRASGHITDIFEKVDGSLGILYRKDGKLRIATRGSFDSTQALKATELLHKKYGLEEASLIPNELTLLFEIVYPDNRIVVDYGDKEELVLLAARNRFTGEYFPTFPVLFNLAMKFGFSFPRMYKFNNPRDIMEASERLGTDEEGFVAVFSDGSRWKFKGDRYVELHGIVTTSSTKRLKAYFLNGTLKSLLMELDESSPVYDLLLGQYMGIVNHLATVRSTVDFLTIAAPDPHENRAAFAEYAKNFPDYSSFLFAHVDKKLTNEVILKSYEGSPT